MVVLSRHRKEARAELARRSLVHAQRLVDAVWAKLGHPIDISAEDTYCVRREGELFIVGFDDPSFEQAAPFEPLEADCGS